MRAVKQQHQQHGPFLIEREILLLDAGPDVRVSQEVVVIECYGECIE